MNNKIEGILDAYGRMIIIDGLILKPHRSQGIYNHSPDGFNWGYGGSGPAQLALAILLEFTTKDNALSLYQTFKWEVVAKLPQTDFEIELDIKEWIKEKKLNENKNKTKSM